MEGKVYLPTTQTPSSNAGSQGRRYDKFTEVYSTSGDTTEFARHVGEYVGQKVPVCLWIGAAVATCFVAFIILLIGAFNLPFCHVQPMIPIYMMVFGCILIIQSIIRIYAVLPTPNRRRRRRNLKSDLVMKGIEFVFLLVNVVWLILGCVWVYGSKPYVHFEEHMFEEHYCEPSLYWSAFAVCTGSLVAIALGLLISIIVMVAGAYRAEAEEQEQELP